MAEDVAYLRHSATEVDDLLDKADEDYSKAEIDTLLASKADISDIPTSALVELVDSGAKNLIKSSWGSTITYRGITFAKNSDNSWTLSGTSTQDYALVTIYEGSIPYPFSELVYSLKTYSPQYRLIVNYYDSNDELLDAIRLSNSPVAKAIPENAVKVSIRIDVPSAGTTINFVVVEPMICTKAAWDISQAYQPYRPSYQELYEMVLALGGGGNRLMSINREEVTGNETNETDNTQGDIS